MTLKDIKKTVEHVTGLSLTKNTRKREYVYARFIYFYLARKYGKKEFIIDGCVKYYDCSLDSIGKLINKDHATVIHGCKQMLIIPQQDEKVNIWLIACEKLVVDQIDDIEDDTEESVNKILLLKHEHRQEIKSIHKDYLFKIKALEDRLKGIDSELIRLSLVIPEENKQEFIDTRLKPYLKLVESREKQKEIIPVMGAIIRP